MPGRLRISSKAPAVFRPGFISSVGTQAHASGTAGEKSTAPPSSSLMPGSRSSPKQTQGARGGSDQLSLPGRSDPGYQSFRADSKKVDTILVDAWKQLTTKQRAKYTKLALAEKKAGSSGQPAVTWTEKIASAVTARDINETRGVDCERPSSVYLCHEVDRLSAENARLKKELSTAAGLVASAVVREASGPPSLPSVDHGAVVLSALGGDGGIPKARSKGMGMAAEATANNDKRLQLKAPPVNRADPESRHAALATGLGITVAGSLRMDGGGEHERAEIPTASHASFARSHASSVALAAGTRKVFPPAAVVAAANALSVATIQTRIRNSIANSATKRAQAALPEDAQASKRQCVELGLGDLSDMAVALCVYMKENEVTSWSNLINKHRWQTMYAKEMKLAGFPHWTTAAVLHALKENLVMNLFDVEWKWKGGWPEAALLHTPCRLHQNE